jgi:hypothetical protein
MKNITNVFTKQTTLNDEVQDQQWIARNPNRNHHIRRMRPGEFTFGTHVLIHREQGGVRRIPVFTAERGVIQ